MSTLKAPKKNGLEMRRMMLTGAALLAALSQATSLAQPCKPIQMIDSIQMKPNADHSRELVPITINGAEKNFLLDSGGYLTQLGIGTVYEMKLSQKPGNNLRGLGGKSDKVVVLDTFQLGNMRAKNLEVQVLINSSLQNTGAVGLLAPDLMYAYDVEMDFSADVLKFFAQDHCEGPPDEWRTNAIAAVPFSIDSGHIVFPVVLDGQKIQALMDTGAPTSVITRSAAYRKFNVEVPVSYNAALDARHQFGQLSLEGIEVRNPILKIIGTYGDEHGYDYPFGRKSEVLLGMDILSKLHIFIAIKERKMYIMPASAPAKTEIKQSVVGK